MRCKDGGWMPHVQGHNAKTRDELSGVSDEMCLPDAPLIYKRYIFAATNIHIMKQQLKDSGIIGLAALFLLSFLQPFGIDQMSGNRMLLITGGAALASVSSLLSATVVKWLTGHDTHTMCGLLLMHAVNVPVLSALTLTMVSWFTWDSLTRAWYCTAGEFSVINYLTTCLEVSLLSFFVLVLQMYQMRNDRLRQELDEVRAINQLLEERGDDAPDGEPDAPRMTCVLRGGAKNAVLEVCPADIIYIESMSNYADICCLDGDAVTHHSLRITMKQLRDDLADYPWLVACHRAFLVNINFVTSISGRPSTGCDLHLFHVDKAVPVARSCTRDIHDRLARDKKA